MKPDSILKRLERRLTGRRPPKDKLCVICKQAVEGFEPYRGGWAEAPALMRLLDVVGSDIDHFACPACSSHDRERHLWLYLERLGLLQRFRDAQVLHVAPEKRLAKLLLALGPARYVKADLFPSEPDIEKLDLLDIGGADARFQIVLANHVLEHVSDDRQALREIHRVLAPGGFAILQTPYSARLHATVEDPGIDDDRARLAIYGQEDHVRLFGRDIFARFEASGLVAEIHWHDELMPDVDPLRHGVNLREPLFLFHRR
jgi:SAM-dependent methyltransferase